MITMRVAMMLVGALLWLAPPAFAQPAGEVTYAVTIPEPEHHWLQVEVTFPDLESTPLIARMSRSSPGRYATHEFAKNIFALEARNRQGQPLPVTRTSPDEWRVDEHDGAVRIVYRIFGDHADGTYMAVDTTHAHLNGPATFLWASGLETRPIRITLTPPPGVDWAVGTQLIPTAEPRTFTAPNLQYFLDSPIEFANLVTSVFTIEDATTGPATFRLMVHGDASQADVDALAVLVRRLVREQSAVFGSLPPFEPGHYTFLLDYMPWTDADAMEHRNSTAITDPGASLSTPDGRLAVLGSISHELFHVWNVERIRPTDLEPFDFTRANVSCCLWFAEGFTQYYGPLLLHRAGLSNALPIGFAIPVINGSGRVVRSAVEMSQQAPFADAGVANDAHDRSRSYISYYTYGAALALGLDLSLREKTAGRITLDHYMQRLWQRYGVQPNGSPGVVTRPYTLADLRRELGELVGDASFAAGFFDRYVEGRDVLDYRALLALAGYVVRPTAPGRGWIGTPMLQDTDRGLRIAGLTGFNTPIHAAGIDSGDTIVSIDGQPASRSAWDAIGRRAPGTTIDLVVERRGGRRDATAVIVAADPALQIVPAESLGALAPGARVFRDTWLKSHVPAAGSDAR